MSIGSGMNKVTVGTAATGVTGAAEARGLLHGLFPFFLFFFT
jgi:hypothetical protein